MQNVPTESTPMEETPTSDDRLWALLAYIFSPLIPIIILLLEDKKNRPYLKQHTMQALAVGVAFTVILIILSFIPLVQCISPLVALAMLALLIYWGIQAYNGKTVTIPVITNFVKDQGWA